MALYFYGDLKEMAARIESVLIAEHGFNPVQSKVVQSPDEILIVDYRSDPTIKVSIQDTSMIHDNGEGYKVHAKPHLKRVVDVLEPHHITDVFGNDITATLGVKEE